jgi:hypothetical protein
MLRDPRAIYLDTRDQMPLYVFDPRQHEAGEIVARVNFTTKLVGQGRQVVNAVRSGGLVNEADIARSERYH